MNPILSRGVLLSFLGHLTVFSVFTFSFGNKIPAFDYSAVVFRGEILSSADLRMPLTGFAIKARNHKTVPADKTHTLALDRSVKGKGILILGQPKPQVALPVEQEKVVFFEKRTQVSKSRNEPVIVFYPRLPQSFILYFQDRQTVHIELGFNITSTDSIKSITVQRKISSGNLEADLLSARYISRYLFMQQSRFPINSWQTVKIDLSTKN